MKRFAFVIIQFKESENVSVLRNTENAQIFLQVYLKWLKWLFLHLIQQRTHKVIKFCRKLEMLEMEKWCIYSKSILSIYKSPIHITMLKFCWACLNPSLK
jgi:hypothetical protein